MNNEKVLVVPTAHICLSQTMNSLKKKKKKNVWITVIIFIITARHKILNYFIVK